jgi:hypothetical protein
MKKAAVFLAALVIFGLMGAVFAQPVKKTVRNKVPKYSISVLGGFNYVFGNANGDASGFTALYKETGGSTFTAQDLGMQQGYGFMVQGKVAFGKKRKFRMTGNLGYNLFYNTYESKRNRTMWNIMNLGTGVEYNFGPKQRERLFVGYELNYSLIFGGWQHDITYPDNSVSNVYTKFEPANRLGMALTAGMEFRLSKKTDLTVALRGVWSNALFKQNNETNKPFYSSLNDAKSNNGIILDGNKEIIFIQLVTGITLPISYK